MVAGGNDCSIALDTGKTYSAKFVAGDSDNDIAILKVDVPGLQAAEIGDSDNLTVGDRVYAIGNPLGVELRGTLTDGIVSAINRDVEVDGRTMTLIQTNAALNSGNSGGPLINCYGQVVGINTIKMSSSYSNIEGLGFALPTSSVQYLVNDLLTYGKVRPEPVIGISVSQVPTALPDGTQGIEVYEVSRGSAAEEAGILEGDIVVSADGESTVTSKDLLRIRRRFNVGDQMSMAERACPDCQGKRLKKESLAVTVGGINIFQFTSLSVGDELKFLDGLELGKTQTMLPALFYFFSSRCTFRWSYVISTFRSANAVRRFSPKVTYTVQ